MENEQSEPDDKDEDVVFRILTSVIDIICVVENVVDQVVMVIFRNI